jgi:alpha-beta hydrolase superfamily lysophospholipase
MKASSLWFKSDDGTPLYIYRWAPDSPARGIVHIAHGLGEHAARYARTAEALVNRGYLVYANDHRGHGRTAPTRDELGFFAITNGWNRVVSDLKLLMEMEAHQNPRIPAVLLGHSMGSFMAQQFFHQYGGMLAGGVLSGSSGPPDSRVYGLRVLALLERLRLGRRGRSRFLHWLSLRVANRQFQPVRTNFDWLSSDPAEVDLFNTDPLCGFVGTTQLWIDLLDGVVTIARRENRERTPGNLPLLIFAGTRDPVSNNCRGLERLIADYRRAGLTSIQHRFYPEGRHEMLNEVRRQEVLGDLLAWLDSVT